MHLKSSDQPSKKELDFNDILYNLMPESIDSLNWVASWLREHDQMLLADETEAFASMQMEYRVAMEMTLFVYKTLWSLDPEHLDAATIRTASEQCLRRRQCLAVYLTAGNTLKKMLEQQSFVASAKMFTELDEESSHADTYCHMMVHLKRNRTDIHKAQVLPFLQEHVDETMRPWKGFSGLIFSEEEQKWIIPLEIRRWGANDLRVMLEWPIPEQVIDQPYNLHSNLFWIPRIKGHRH